MECPFCKAQIRVKRREETIEYIGCQHVVAFRESDLSARYARIPGSAVVDSDSRQIFPEPL